MTIFGSEIPAREYSLSTCEVGSTDVFSDSCAYSHLGRTCLSLVKFKLLSQPLCILFELRRQRLSIIQGVLELLFAFVRLPFLRF